MTGYIVYNMSQSDEQPLSLDERELRVYIHLQGRSLCFYLIFTCLDHGNHLSDQEQPQHIAVLINFLVIFL